MPIAAAGIAAGGSLLGGALGGKGAAKAARINAAAYQKGLDETTREFNTTQANFAPYLAGGNQALGASLGLMGLNGNDAQSSAIAAIKASPMFTSQYGTGADTLLQNEAATGGLRGGNAENSLANFGSSLLSNVIQQQLSNYGGLVNIGSGAVGNLGRLGQNNANTTANLLAQQGNANATGAAAPYAAAQSTLGGLANIAGNYSTNQLLTSLLTNGSGLNYGGGVGHGVVNGVQIGNSYAPALTF